MKVQVFHKRVSTAFTLIINFVAKNTPENLVFQNNLFNLDNQDIWTSGHSKLKAPAHSFEAQT